MGRKILIVEDDQETAGYLARGLAEDGHLVEHSATGQNGLFRATGETFDLIILDRMLPTLDGLSVLRALRDGVTARATVRSVKRGKVFDLVASPHPSGGAVVTFDDVTELHALTERHRRVVETSTDAIVITDLSRRIAFANPAAIELFAREVDFFSVGTNDLAQYTLAAERGNTQMAALADGLHPAVLQLIAQTVKAAHGHDKPVSVCGELAGDAQAVPLLVGLGVDELSVNAPAIPRIKQLVRDMDYGEARRQAERALTLESAEAVRQAFQAPRPAG